jgi:hypothetical protein
LLDAFTYRGDESSATNAWMFCFTEVDVKSQNALEKSNLSTFLTPGVSENPGTSLTAASTHITRFKKE